MAWVRCCGGASTKKGEIYKEGVWTVGIDNPGSYSQSGYTIIGGTLGADKFTIGPTGGGTRIACLGTTNKFDFTNFSLLNVRCKGITKYDSSHNTYGTVRLLSAKTLGSGTNVIPITKIVSNNEHIITIDVSSVSEAYLAFQCDANETSEVYEIWCQ